MLRTTRSSPPWLVLLGGAPDSLIHGLCTRNAVYSVVNVPMKVISYPSNGSEENGDILAMLIKVFEIFSQAFQTALYALIYPAEINSFCLGNFFDGHA